MAMKEWFRELQPVQLYVILVLSVIFFIVELALSHLTHALTLLMDSYQTLCNIIALSGCLITLKHGKNVTPNEENKSSCGAGVSECSAEESVNSSDQMKSVTSVTQESKLKNTFGWARIDVMTNLICCVTLMSLMYSLLVEALQTLVHIDHSDEMHEPVFVFLTGCCGLLLNGICYLLIGGFTFHQGSFLYVTESGDVVLDKVVTSDSIKKGERRLSRTRRSPTPQYRQRQGVWEILRDCVGCMFVIVCSILIYFTDKEVAKFIDPILSIWSAVILAVLSYPYMKESCLILLQTIPATIDIDILKKHLLQHFPDIVNVHDFHVWQMTANKFICTIHIIFQSPEVYAKIIKEIEDFFSDYGITHVTIQPEFGSSNDGSVKPSCLMLCKSEGCRTCHCCPDLLEIKNTIDSSDSQAKYETPTKEENLTSVTVNKSELQTTSSNENSGVQISTIKLPEQSTRCDNQTLSKEERKLIDRY